MWAKSLPSRAKTFGAERVSVGMWPWITVSVSMKLLSDPVSISTCTGRVCRDQEMVPWSWIRDEEVVDAVVQFISNPNPNRNPAAWWAQPVLAPWGAYTPKLHVGKGGDVLTGLRGTNARGLNWGAAGGNLVALSVSLLASCLDEWQIKWIPLRRRSHHGQLIHPEYSQLVLWVNPLKCKLFPATLKFWN